MKWILFALRNTLRNRRRSLVTVSIAALGCAAILLSSGFALFTYQSLAQSAARDTGHLILARSQYFQREEDTPMQYGIDNFPALRDTLLADRNVRNVLPRVSFSGLISNGDKSVVMMGNGIDPNAEFKTKGPFLKVVAGNVLDGDVGGPAPQVMIGEGLARSLNAKPGGGLTLLSSTSEGAMNAMDVQVKGVFSTGIPEVDKRLVYTDLATAQQLLVTQRVSTVGVHLRDIELTESTQASLRNRLDKDLAVQTWRDQAVFYQAVRALYNRIFGALGIIMACIVLFVVANAMAMAIIERTREIGSLRAVGTQPGQLTRVFAFEGAALGGAGAVLGALLAIIVSIALLFADVQMPAPPGRTVGYPLKIAISAELYLGVMFAITALAMVCATLVGRRAARTPIVEALNHV